MEYIVDFTRNGIILNFIILIGAFIFGTYNLANKKMGKNQKIYYVSSLIIYLYIYYLITFPIDNLSQAENVDMVLKIVIFSFIGTTLMVASCFYFRNDSKIQNM